MKLEEKRRLAIGIPTGVLVCTGPTGVYSSACTSNLLLLQDDVRDHIHDWGGGAL